MLDRDDVEACRRKQDGGDGKRGNRIDAVKNTAKRWSDDQGRLHHRRRCRHRTLQHGSGHDAGQQRCHGRPLEGDGCSHDGDSNQYARRRQPVLPGGDGQQCRYGCEDQLADKADAPPVKAIRDVPDNEGENDHRQKLAEAHQRQSERAVGLIVDHPAHCDGDALK
jgi:hypothetical protein